MGRAASFTGVDPRTARGRIRLWLPALFTFSVLFPASAWGWNAVPLGDHNPDVTSWQSFFDPDGRQGKGHNWITNLAVWLLKKRGLLSRVSWDDVRYIHHGLDFADHPWRGPALRSHLAVPSVRDGDGELFGDGRVLWYPDRDYDIEIYNPIGENYYKVHTFWARGTRPFRNRTKRYANPTLIARWWANTFCPHDSVEHIYAADHLLHYYKEPDEKFLVTVLKSDRWLTDGQKNLSNAPIGSAEYGSVLYQLAQRFWPNDRYPQPELSELPHVWRAGTIHMNPLTDAYLTADFPDTYVGGNPFICAPPDEKTRLKMVAAQRDIYRNCTVARKSGRQSCVEKSLRPYMNTCRYGAPTWPNFVPRADYKEASRFRDELSENAPGKDKRAALVYLGWALHLVQDTAVPHHAKRWTSNNHDKFEKELDNRLKQHQSWGKKRAFEKRLERHLRPYSMKSESICEDLGMPSDVNRELGDFLTKNESTGVKSIFRDTAEEAKAGAKDKWDERMFSAAIDNAVTASLKLLACFGA